MQTLNSDYKQLSGFEFPEYQARQAYMVSFDAQDCRLPYEYCDYNPIIEALLRDAGIDSGEIHMTIDEKIVQPGMSQRKPGPHVDGKFHKQRMAWGHNPGPAWAHFCNNLPVDRMPVIVAASVEGCRVWKGEFHATPSPCGDLSHMDLPEGEILEANRGYLLSPDCIHESMVFEKPTQRQFIRLALPVDSIKSLDQ